MVIRETYLATLKMARVKTTLLYVCIYIVSAATIASNTPLPSNGVYLTDERLLEELEELSNRIHSKSHQSSGNTEVENAIYPEVEVEDQPPIPIEELQVLDEHINIPTTIQSDDFVGDTDSLELQLFEVGTDDQGNRIYNIKLESEHLEKELQSLENEVGASASGDEDDDDLEEQLENLPQRHPSGDIDVAHTAVPSGMESSDETSSSSGDGDSSSDGSGDGLDIGSGDESLFLKETIESSGGSHLVVEFTDEEGSGVSPQEDVPLEAGFAFATVADVVDESGSGSEMSGSGVLETEEPVFVYTTLITELVEEEDITTMTTTTMTTKTSTDETLTQTEKPVVRHCPDSQFECSSNHHCIPHSTVCDLISDCDDQSDEDPALCTPERSCNDGYFKCGSSPQCVEEYSRCDGIYHCYNGEDETNCLTCEDLHGHIKKLLQSDFCDGTRDCKNNMDEDRKRCVKPCPAGYQRCDDGLQCIKEGFVCDGIYNCHDKSDEQKCSRTMLDCWTFNMFACDDICQPQSALCDYYEDCADGSDEKGCKYGKPETCPKRFVYQPETRTCLHSSLINSEPYDLLQILDQTQHKLGR